MKHAPITTLVAVLLMAAVSAAEADDDQPPASANLSQPAQQAQGKLSTSRDLQRSRATPSLAGRRNASNIHRAGDAGSLPSRTPHPPHSQRWKWSANQVPEALVTPL